MNTNASRTRPSEWSNPRSHIVHRNLQYRLPAGLAWNGPLVRGVIGPNSPTFMVSKELWSVSVAASTCGVVLVSAVLARMSPETVFEWYRLHEPYKLELLSRRPTFEGLPAGAVIGVRAVSARQGEVLAWPVRPVEAREGPFGA